jgi:hypothetical protein
MYIYLYVKTHNKTGLKYLGKTVAKDPHKYKGSGDYWRQHITKYGYDVTTTIIRECHTKEELQEWGLYYSTLWNVVNSRDESGRKIWANLKPESGDGGSCPGRKITYSAKISETMKGRPAHNKGKKQPHKPHKPHKHRSSTNTKGSNGRLLGISRPRLCCLVCKKETDIANISRYHTH